MTILIDSILNFLLQVLMAATLIYFMIKALFLTMGIQLTIGNLSSRRKSND